MFDPFGINSQINSMLGNMMGDPFAPPGNNNNNNNNNNRNNNRNNSRNNNQQMSLRNNFDPFGMNMQSPFDMHHNQMMNMGMGMGLHSNPFGMMNQMMQSSFNGGSSGIINADPNSQVFSSSSVMTVTNDNGKPKVYQQSTQVQQGPGGVKETRNLVRDSEKGIEKVSIGHHIGDKAHVIERQKQRGGDVEEIVNLENLDEEEINEFNKEFENKIRNSHMSSHHNQHQHRAHPHINSHQNQPFAIEDGQHGHKKERKSKSKPKY